MTPEKLSDEEIICQFMEPMPQCGIRQILQDRLVIPIWWGCAWDGWQSIVPDLTELYEVESRLSDEQWGEYGLKLAESLQSQGWQYVRNLIHASSAQKIRALAEVLRPEVER